MIEYLKNTSMQAKIKNTAVQDIDILIIRYTFCDWKLPRKKDFSVYVKIVSERFHRLCESCLLTGDPTETIL